MPRSKTGWHCNRCHNDAKYITGVEQLNSYVYVWSVLRDLDPTEVCWQVERSEYTLLCRHCWRAQMTVLEDDGYNVVRVR